MTEQKTEHLIHRCHAENCNIIVSPNRFMCLKHWRMVPLALQRLIWQHYREGQEIDKQPSVEYLNATKLAKKTVLAKETKL